MRCPLAFRHRNPLKTGLVLASRADRRHDPHRNVARSQSPENGSRPCKAWPSTSPRWRPRYRNPLKTGLVLARAAEGFSFLPPSTTPSPFPFPPLPSDFGSYDSLLLRICQASFPRVRTGRESPRVFARIRDSRKRRPSSPPGPPHLDTRNPMNARSGGPFRLVGSNFRGSLRFSPLSADSRNHQSVPTSGDAGHPEKAGRLWARRSAYWRR